ncbi:glycine betaine ABC transporter substrate-binding protein [Roseomonas marmotae]|uniref:Glycine betaine ABC transporter substrate-binding protein n=1 Tax=Roseomonas marmotae TaxID=2768161 RepID=A0ABS3K8R9_9PROT|nr:glycine betaine ABC transporter substrate-binding protein [Roseomonas marmotae]MBO1073855.1 glycine betaine ABC transporter substrate-binding protein [Roseomonas marmotae]QTI78517.1 glycine betaine ABC transporter substrate-binding protein [Roseomonas marmotae]
MTLKKREFLGLTAGLATALATGTLQAQPAKPVKLGYAPWTDAEFITKLAARLIQDRLKTKVVLVQTDVAPLYQGIMRGDLDAVLMCWLPKTHRDYWARAEGKVERLGKLYTGKMGLAVPSYVPEEEVASIADLAKAEVRGKMGGRIQTIEPGAGMTRLVHETVKAYGLDYSVQESGEAGMLTMLQRSIRAKDWIVFSAWNPHWMFNKFDIRYLDDPKLGMGEEEDIVAAGRLGLGKDRPQVAAFLSRMNMPLDELQKAMLAAQEKDIDAVVDWYVSEHAARVDGWFTAA